MKRLLTIIAILIWLFIQTKPSCAISTSYDDLWDISQGSVVTAHSKVWSVHSMWSPPLRGSDIRNMFGGCYGYPWPGENTALGRNTSAGTIHWVEWQTPSPITLRSFNLVTMHDPPPKDIRKRGFSQFRLYWAVASVGPWTILYELADTDPDGDLYYGGGPTYPEQHYLELAVNVAPTTAQNWRAEFVQYANTGYYDAGVRVIELDGYDTFLAPSNIPPVADAGPDQIVELETCEGTEVILDGSGSSDPDGDSLTYEWTWDGGSASGVNPTVVLPLGTTIITLVVNDGTTDSDQDTVNITVEDTVSPEIEITFPTVDLALQDGVTLAAIAEDLSGVSDVYFYVREPDGGDGIPIGYEELPATWNDVTELWELEFDTTELPDGYYVVLARAVDMQGNEGWCEVIPFSIHNWAVVELLPASESNKAGRTMPVKYSLRIGEAVDADMPFVYNEELEVIIYDAGDPSIVLQTSLFGDTSRDYRINIVDELYITNFKTMKQPAEYVVEIWRLNEDFLVGNFTFETVK